MFVFDPWYSAKPPQNYHQLHWNLSPWNSKKVISQCLKVMSVFAKHHKINICMQHCKGIPSNMSWHWAVSSVASCKAKLTPFLTLAISEAGRSNSSFKRGSTRPSSSSSSSSSLISEYSENWKQNLKNCSRNFSPTKVGVMQ